MGERVKIYAGLIIFALLLLCQPDAVLAANSQSGTADITLTPTPEEVSVALNGLYKVNGRYYYNKNARPLKNTWKRVKGKLYYFQSDGAAAVGPQKINGKKYLFNGSGVLKEGKKTRFLTYKGEKYYVKKDGTVTTGWQIIGSRLYYFSKVNGRMFKSKTEDGIKLTAKGYAKTSDKATKLKIKTMQMVASLTTSKMTKVQKLKACYKYMASRDNIPYRTWREYRWYSGWERDYGYEVLTKKAGNCYNMACGFAYLAKEVGYEVYVVRARIKSSGAGDGDGYTPHTWVRIDGYFYDPGFPQLWKSKIFPRDYRDADITKI